MAHKYKLKEAPAPNLAKQVGAKIGDVSYSKDGDTKFVVNSIDRETGQIGWKVIELPAFDKLNDDVEELVSTAKGVYTKTKSDEEFRKIYEEARLLRNKIRKHLRNEYPDEYKRMTMEGEVNEAYSGFRRGEPEDPDSIPFKPTGSVSEFKEDLRALFGKFKGDLNNPDFIKGVAQIMVSWKSLLRSQLDEEDVDEISTSGGAGSYLTPYAFRKKGAKADDEAYTELGYTLAKEGKLGNGSDLGPGPKASEDGVKDNAYVKQFKYKLVPKNKKGNYVQKGSGLEVKNV
jgi:hypothetical protein